MFYSIVLLHYVFIFSNSGLASKVNYKNGLRQAGVNYIAESVGASSGTFRKFGVPGTRVEGYPDGYASAPYKPGFFDGVGFYPRG